MGTFDQDTFDLPQKEINKCAPVSFGGIPFQNPMAFHHQHFMPPPPFNPFIPPPPPHFVSHGNFAQFTTMGDTNFSINYPANNFMTLQNHHSIVNGKRDSYDEEYLGYTQTCQDIDRNDVGGAKNGLETMFINDWLTDKKDKFESRTQGKCSKWMIDLPEFKKSLKRVTLLNELISVISKCLDVGCRNCSCGEIGKVKDCNEEDVVTEHQMFVEHTKVEVADIMSRINDEVVADVGRKLKERKKKRERLKRKREREKNEEYEREEKMNQIEGEMERWQERVAEAEAAMKKEKEVSKAADEILFEVRRKIADVKKSMKTLASLQKLREARFNKKSGMIPSEVSEIFMDRLESLFGVLKKQLVMYEGEQRALQVMLNTEHEADREKENKRKKAKVKEEVNQECQSILKLLFGREAQETDSTYPFYQFYDLPNKDLNAFIQVRHQWDQHLVPRATLGSSKIPPNWVPPSEPSSETWASFLTDPNS